MKEGRVELEAVEAEEGTWAALPSGYVFGQRLVSVTAELEEAQFRTLQELSGEDVGGRFKARCSDFIFVVAPERPLAPLLDYLRGIDAPHEVEQRVVWTAAGVVAATVSEG